MKIKANGTEDEVLPNKRTKIERSELPMAFKVSKNQSVRKALKNDSIAEVETKRLFNKRFEIEGEYLLPEAETMFTEDSWTVEELQTLKNNLNETKSKLNDYNLHDWHHHTKSRNKASKVLWRLKEELKVEYLTQAWCKFYENACLFPLVPQKVLETGRFSSVHLCEAPGAFVAALNHWLRSRAPKIDWEWLGVSLNPHYEGNSLTNMVEVDSLINRTEKNWFFGADNTGNLMSLENLDALIIKTKDRAINLVTADGSIDCVDTPAEQEQVVSQLHYCETVAALHLLEKGGNFLLKIFTIFENRTLCLTYLLACCFDRVIINKPVNSREGNSEVYVICLGFTGSDRLKPHLERLRNYYENLSDKSMFRREDIPESFVQQIIDCGKFFTAHQCEAILSNLRTFRSGRYPNPDPEIHKIKQLVSERFVKTYDLKPLPTDDMKILGNEKITDKHSKIFTIPWSQNSYNSRQKQRDRDPRRRLASYEKIFQTSRLPSNAEKFELDVVPGELLVSIGKPYEKIENSKFSAAGVVQLYNEVLRLGHELGYSGRIPSPEVVKEFEEENKLANKVLNFEYTSATDNHKLINRIHNAVSNLENDQSLCLLGYSMLSRLSVGLLYLLARTFESVEIEPSDNLGCIVTLKIYKKVEEVEKIFEEILRASRAAEEIGQVVLSVLPITTLCGSKRYEDIVKMNHRIMKHCVQHVVANCKEHPEDSSKGKYYEITCVLTTV